ncbi:MAG TPA: hypothetical protein DEG43_17435 [Acidimicrobiaceae bacterium]|nr:hypothetical protein [Acidimicrobiaceae bacterium]
MKSGGDDHSTSAPNYLRRRLIAGGAAAGVIGGTGIGLKQLVEALDFGGTNQATAPNPPAAKSGPAEHDPEWIRAENDNLGNPDWQVPENAPQIWDRIRGFASYTSVNQGDPFNISVSTKAKSWFVEAYRIGWYGGAGARLIWRSDTQPGIKQAPAVQDPDTRQWSAPWESSLRINTDDSWVPGMYLLRLISADFGLSYIPITIRDDRSTSALLVQSSVTTWQAYNEWGGASLYKSTGTTAKNRSYVVTFDRPYYRKGSGEFFGREYEFILWAERLGLDLSYCTNIDTHLHPERILQHNAFISLGHDEYYSTAMRRGVENARDEGVNLLFLGANACFRKVRLEENPEGRPARQLVNYRDAQLDPLHTSKPSEVTTSWRDGPEPEPESSLIGNYYEANPVEADMVVAHSKSWVFTGTGLANGDAFTGVVGNEYDRVTPEVPTPDNIEVLFHSPVVVKGKKSFADMTYYTASSGAGVIATGTLWWIPQLAPVCQDPSAPHEPLNPACAIQTITKNIINVFGNGPAAKQHPSVSNLKELGIHKGYIKHPPR